MEQSCEETISSQEREREKKREREREHLKDRASIYRLGTVYRYPRTVYHCPRTAKQPSNTHLLHPPNV